MVPPALVRPFLIVLFTVCALLLGGCDSAEERADTHFRAALELIAAGDTRRATVELQNVFKLAPSHVAARLAFAQMLETGGNPAEAYRQYLRLAEQTPDNPDAQRALARLAADQGNWPEVDRHLAAALALVGTAAGPATTPPGTAQPETGKVFDPAVEPVLAAVAAAADYARAIADDDDAARRAAARRAALLLADQPETLLLHRIVINDLLRDGDNDAAGRAVDAALAIAPRDREFHTLRLAVLSAGGDAAAIEAHLRDMARLFPDDPATGTTLLRWYISRGETDKAETVLRDAVAAAAARADPAAAAAGSAAIPAAPPAPDTASAATDPGSADALVPRDPVTAAQVTLVRFLARFRSPAAALAEVEAAIADTGAPAGPAPAQDAASGATKDAAGPTPEVMAESRAVLRALRAGLIHDTGDTAAAIAELEAVLAESGVPVPGGNTPETGAAGAGVAAGPGVAAPAATLRTIAVGLARMLEAKGDTAAARARVAAVLAQDPGHLGAVRMQAGWLIADDAPGEAIALLRQALELAPRDAALMTLLAQAHERNGDRDLMGEMLALAVEAADRAVPESLRYAAFLMQTDRLPTAETVLIEALRRAPADTGVLARLGELYIRQNDWARATAVADQLDGIGAATPSAAAPPQQAQAAALAARAAQTRAAQTGRALRTAILQGRDQGGSAGAAADPAAVTQSGAAPQTAVETYLDGLIRQGVDGFAPQIARIRLQLSNGQSAAARDAAAGLVADNPGNPTPRFVLAAVQAATGEAAAAEAELRALAAEDPARLPVWLALYQLLADQRRPDAAAALLDEALLALPDATELVWAKAVQLEQSGDIEAAIALYERLYAQDTASTVFANNLASLLLAARDDPASLERAFVVGRRLRDTPLPAFQDTYGWLMYRRGNHDEALTYLEPAAAALTGDAQAQIHLAAVYAALGRPAEALAQYRRGLALTAAGDTRGFVRDARAAAERLASPPGGNAGEAGGNAAGKPAD